MVISSLEKPVELRPQRHGVDNDRVVPVDVEHADLQGPAVARGADIGGWSMPPGLGAPT
jgi:hypothetical protein